MADDTGSPPTTNAPTEVQPTPSAPAPIPSTSEASSNPPNPTNRQDLITKARSFLLSPQTQYYDITTKRKFLADKGLSQEEITRLLRETPALRPIVPPRTYPQPPPSNLPRLLLGVIRLFSWMVGGSLALMAIYHQFILPRIADTLAARHALKTHHLMLMTKLTNSLSELKASQKEMHSVLPSPAPYKEPEEFTKFHTVKEVLEYLDAENKEVEDVPPVTFLRCAIEMLSKDRTDEDSKPTTHEVLQHLEEQISWFATDDGLLYEEKLWDTIVDSPLFSASTTTADGSETKVTRWTYVPPVTPPPPPLVASLSKLRDALPKTSTKERPYQRTLQILTDFTGDISMKVHLPYHSTISTGFGLNKPVAEEKPSVEEDIRREIREIKGLLLNRKTFMSARSNGTIPHPS
ncbi:hypothetical protein BDN72DRAFT_821582 [Pluteus cervinus]|uniref:Uncharacterized protein n=1 Tax=Pluteus cervinus TaxID=181527 RepID=A0ACD3ARP9_9AGAR|nr:hypothetical protein BDN72DRAFT_821582 [Pluteus cervinus]